jgi:hypothetical protein
MAKLNFDISMSLDGFVTASNVSPDEPAGWTLSHWPGRRSSSQIQQR